MQGGVSMLLACVVARVCSHVADPLCEIASEHIQQGDKHVGLCNVVSAHIAALFATALMDPKAHFRQAWELSLVVCETNLSYGGNAC